MPDVPVPTTAVILVAETIVNEVAAESPKLTAFAPIKFVPVIVTVAPNMALVGVKEVMVGTGGVVYVNPAKLAVPPPGTVTLMLPVAPEFTTAVIVVGETTVAENAAVPPKFTVEFPAKLVPVMVTVLPDVALVGAKEATVGAGNTRLLSTESELDE